MISVGELSLRTKSTVSPTISTSNRKGFDKEPENLIRFPIVLPHPTISIVCKSNSGSMTFNARKVGSSGWEGYRAALMSRNTSSLSGFNLVSPTGGVHAGGEPVLVVVSYC